MEDKTFQQSLNQSLEEAKPVCPYCWQKLWDTVMLTRPSPLGGYIVIVSCPACHKVIGTAWQPTVPPGTPGLT